MSATWGWVLPYLARERRGLAGLLGASAATVALAALAPWPLKLIVDHVLAGAPLPPVVAWIGKLPGAATTSGLLLWLVASTALLFLLACSVEFMSSVVQTGVSARLKYGLAGDVFSRLQRLSLIYHRQGQKGDLLHRVTSDTDCLPTVVTGALLPACVALLSLLAYFAIMWQLDAVLAALAMLVALPTLVLIRVLAPRMTERAYEHQQREGEVWSIAEQGLSSLPVIQAFGREEHEGGRFRSVAERTVRAHVRNTLAQVQFSTGVNASEAAGIALVMFIGGLHVQQGALSVGGLVVFLSYLASLYGPLDTLSFVPSTLAGAAASGRRVRQVLDSAQRVESAPGARAIAVPAAGVRGHIRLEGVCFGYQPDVPVLHEIDLEIPAGHTVALVGPTGGGKTTLVSLIPRLFDPCRGRVLVDGHDVRLATIDSVRSQVAFVLQDACLLPISISDNIAYGRPQACRDEVIAAAVAANADGFIRRLPQGYDTVIGERGATLSGGQKQRLAIARALLRDAPILIMDEPTSALDVETESLLLEAVERLRRNRTTLIIAHRLSTVRHADSVVVVDSGRIAERGTHGSLLRAGGRYAQMVLAQDPNLPAGAPLLRAIS